MLENEDVEAAVPVERHFPGSDRVRVYELPATRVASLVHHGDYRGFRQAHVALVTWMDSNGYRPTGTYREIYVETDDANPANSVTEIQYPVEQAI